MNKAKLWGLVVVAALASVGLWHSGHATGAGAGTIVALALAAWAILKK